MPRRIFKGLFVVTLLLFSSSFIQAADTQIDYESTKNKVLNVQAVNPNLPIVSGQDQKGSIGYIISKMFDSNGKIGNWFLKVLGTRSDGKVLRWSGGNEGQFVAGSIYDNGTNVGIGVVPSSSKLNVGGNIQVDNTSQKIYTNNLDIVSSSSDMSINYRAANLLFTSDSGEKIRFLRNGNVGIGDTTPSYKLDVSGDINFTGNIRKNGTVLNLAGKFQDGATAGDIYYNGSNVGIGTNNPQHSLHLEKVGGPGIVWINPTGTVGKKGMRLAFDNDRLTFQRTSDTGWFEANYLAIDQDTGNVGIGMTDPQNALHVNKAGFNPGLNDDATLRLEGNWGGGLIFSEGTGRAGIWSASGNDLRFGVGGTTAGFSSYGGAMTISSNENVGIGTANPQEKLHVNGNTTTNLLTFNKGVGGNSEQAANPYGIYQESGAWTFPYPDLVIGYHTGIKIGGHKLNNGTRFYNEAPGIAGSSVVMEVANGNDNVKVNYNLEVNGNVGIGTTSPQSKLHVNGTIRTSGGSSNFVFEDTTVGETNYLIHNNSDRLYFMHDANENMTWDDGDDDRIVMYGAGDGVRLGIGTSSATQKLDVKGNAIISGGLMRTTHSAGGFIGSYNNIGENSSKTNPIYSIGSSYLPTDSTLANHFGIGYSHASNSSFIPGSGGWGMYVAAGGAARIFLDGSTGKVRASGYCDINGNDCITPTTGAIPGTWCGMKISLHGSPIESCDGHDPQTSCPTGYTSKEFINMSSIGSGRWYSCFKN